MIDQRLTFITLGVTDLEKAKVFYTEKFGWKPMNNDEGVVFFKLNGIILSLFPRHELAKDAGVPSTGSGFRAFSLAMNYGSEKEVDEVFDKLGKKGVNIIKAPTQVFWGGYSGYVEDMDHNLWEIAYNPFLQMDGQGNVVSQPGNDH